MLFLLPCMHYTLKLSLSLLGWKHSNSNIYTTIIFYTFFSEQIRPLGNSHQICPARPILSAHVYPMAVPQRNQLAPHWAPHQRRQSAGCVCAGTRRSHAGEAVEGESVADQSRDGHRCYVLEDGPAQATAVSCFWCGDVSKPGWRLETYAWGKRK